MANTMEKLAFFNTSDPSMKAPSFQQFGFMTALSGDAISEIFRYLEQEECLTTMAVCRYWYYSIPQFAQGLWTTLRVGPQHVGNQRLYYCLGDHVKHVVFKKFKNEQELHTIMHKLLEYGCTKIESLELNRCTTAADQEVFVRVLQKLSRYVTHLKMLRHDCDVAFLNVLSACPQLTHFIYRADYGCHVMYDAEPIDVDTSIHDHFPTITHLCLDAVLDRQLRVDPILRRCPNLRCFVGANLRRKKFFRNISYDRISVDFDLLFQWCSKITHIEDTYGYYFAPIFDNTVADSTGGLQHLSICQVYQPDTVVQHLTNSQDTLNFLTIRSHERNSDGFNWLSVFQFIHLSKLRYLGLGNLGLHPELIVVVVNSCPAIETLVLYDELIFNRHAIRHFEPIRQLHTLCLREVSLASDVSFMRFLAKFPALEKLAMSRSTVPLIIPEGYQSPKNLKDLDLRRIEWIHDDGVMSIKEAILQWFQCFATHSNLQHITLLRLSSFDIQMFPSIAGIPTLKSLSIQINERQRTATEEDGLCQFASLLKATVIEELYMKTWWHLPKSVLDELQELPRLKVHRVSHRSSTLPCTHCTIARTNIPL